MSFIGIDSLLLKQKYKQGFRQFERKGLIGVGVEVKDLDKFNTNYQKILQDLHDSNGCANEKPVCCSRDLIESFEFDNISDEIRTLEEIKSKVLPFVHKVHFCYSYIFGLTEVSIYGATPNYKKIPVNSHTRGVQDFYDLLEPTYAMHCAWAIQQNNQSSKLFLDNFQSRLSPSWDLLKKDNLRIYYQGDRCNFLISLADMFTRLMKLKMYPALDCFLLDGIERITAAEFGEKVELHFLGKKYLKEIVPNDTKKVFTHKLIAHPMFFIAKESSNDSAEIKSIESSPIFNKIIRECVEKDGCFKYYEKGNDEKLMKDIDYFIAFGEKGEESLKKLTKLGHKIKKLS